MPFHVFVEGAHDASPDGVRKLAQAMSQTYGLPAADLVTRLTAGRFRVKANADRATADAMVRTLEQIGARVVVEDTDAAAAPARPSSSSMPPANRPQSGTLPTQPRTTTGDRPSASKPQMQSGLAAAYTSDRAQSEGDFRLLGGDSLSLASLDGNDAGTSSAADNYAPAVPAPMPAPAPPRTVTAQGAKAKPASGPVDLFRPPDAEDDELNVDVAAEEVSDKAERARKQSLPPQQGATPTAGSAGSAAMRYSQKVEHVPVTSTIKEEMPRGRFAAGVFLCVILGFLPAHVIAGGHQRDGYAEIDAQVNATQAAAVTDEDAYNALENFRAAQVSNKQSVRRTSILMALGLWAVAGAILAFIFFTRIPWDTLGKKPTQPA